MLFLAYQVFTLVMLPVLLCFLVFRKVKNKPIFGSFTQRIGLVPKLKDNSKSIWIHAVSVGEMLSIEYFIDMLQKELGHKNITCYVTTGTLAGKKIAEKNIRADYISFMPYDFLFSMLLAFRRIKPCAIIAVEAETWPNFLMLARYKKIPVYLLNARISTRSYKKLSRLKVIFSKLFSVYTHIFTQSVRDKKLFEQFGISHEKLSVLGNIKAFNVVKKKDALVSSLTGNIRDITTYKQKSPYKILLVGSVHPGELDYYLKLYTKIKREFSHVKIILAPRHFHWKQELQEKIIEAGFSREEYFMWHEHTEEKQNTSQHTLDKLTHDILPKNDIILVCTIGKLFALCSIADIFYLGGTFVPIGGHNLLEPAIWGTPMIIGPHYQNTKVIAAALEASGALKKAHNSNKLFAYTYDMLKKHEAISLMGQKAHEWAQQEAASVTKNIDFLVKKIRNL